METISICNISSTSIPLKDIEFTFNYNVNMPDNIWGQPWVAWKKASQQGTAVVLKGGTPYSQPLPPDPNCAQPLTIQFNAAPNLPQPMGPFVFKTEGGEPVSQGNLTINLVQAPAPNLPTPTVSVTGSNYNQQQTLNWGGKWEIKNLIPGTYTINGNVVNNGSNFYSTLPVQAIVVNQQTTNQTIEYKSVPVSNVIVKLINAPISSLPVNFTGKVYSLVKTVTHDVTLSLPQDSYTVSATISGYTITITPNPLSLPGQAQLSLTFVKNSSNSTGPYSTENGQIIDKYKNPVTFKGVNWFGFNTETHIVHGLWTADFNKMLNQIKALGFNAVRIPFQFDFIHDSNIKPSSIASWCDGAPCNQDIPQDSALKAFQWIVKKFTDNGLYVLLDDHYEDNTYVNNYAKWLSGWEKVAQMFIDNPMVGYDLYNEPDSHNLSWESNTSGKAWGIAIHEAASSIYAIDPAKLIFIEGTAQGNLESNWGDGFATDNAVITQAISNPKNFFTQLATKPYVHQIVISPHVYGPNGTNGNGPDHSNQTRAYAAWSRLHGYLLNNFLNINAKKSGFCIGNSCRLYPIAVGEFGGKFDPADPDYAKDVATNINLATFLNKLGEGKPAQPSWFYWDWNPNSGNTGGILKNDWRTYDCNKVNYLRTYLGLKPNAGICA